MSDQKDYWKALGVCFCVTVGWLVATGVYTYGFMHVIRWLGLH